MRNAYEWETNNEVNANEHIVRLEKEIDRIENVTLKANWGENTDGRNVWVKKLEEKKSQLEAFKEM